MLSEVQSPLNQSFRGAVAVSPEPPASRWRLPGLPRWVTWLVELTVVRLLLGLQSRVDVVGVIVGFGGGVELRSGAACLQAERRERLRCCPPTYFDLAFDASGVRLKLLFRSVP